MTKKHFRALAEALHAIKASDAKDVSRYNTWLESVDAIANVCDGNSNL